MKELKAALFDLDGVVFDTEPQYSLFWGEQFREFYPGRTGLEREIKGQTLVQIYDKYFNGSLSGKRDVITARLNEYERNMTFVYVAGLETFVESLRDNGVKTAVVTSSNNDKMQAVYRSHPEFRSMFDAILTSEDFERSKPDPDCYLKGAARFGAARDECIVLEDSFNGLKSGRAAGMRVVGLSTTNSPESIAPLCDMTISNYREMTYDQCVGLLNRLN